MNIYKDHIFKALRTAFKVVYFFPIINSKEKDNYIYKDSYNTFENHFHMMYNFFFYILSFSIETLR